jgi:hypothetical protein
MRIDGDSIYLSGLKEDVDLEALREEIESEWLEMAKQEAILKIRDGILERGKALKPADFDELMARLQLGRLKDEDKARLNEYFDALDSLEGVGDSLRGMVALVQGVKQLNAYDWPEWVRWERIPEKPLIYLSSSSPVTG